MNKKTALVTGANRGIGFEVARQLARAGYTVWLGARDELRGAQAERTLTAEGGVVRSQQLDVSSDDSVAGAVSRIEAESDHLDILVNNAGVALDRDVSPSEVTLDVIRQTFEVNVFGCVRVTQAFMRLLKRSKAARIVMVSSDMGSHAHQTNSGFAYYNLNPMAYISSKAALNAVTIAFAKELRGTRMKVNSANPGFTATGLNGYRGLLSVEEGAAPIVMLATLDDDGPTGQFFGPSGAEPW